MNTPLRIVVMGVSGCGKSTLARALAEHLGLSFLEGDDLHPLENRKAMIAGRPLDDAMRAPWLERISAKLAAAPAPGVVATCSALKKDYRERLRRAENIIFVHPTLDRDAARLRIGTRSDHYMPASLAESQFATLEGTEGEEDVITVDACMQTQHQVSEILPRLRSDLTEWQCRV